MAKPTSQNQSPKKQESGPRGTYVEVRDNNINQAMRRLKKILTQEGLFKELRDRKHFEKPSMTRKKAKAAARKRWLKDQAKRENW